jgi:hypothetical protein
MFLREQQLCSGDRKQNTGNTNEVVTVSPLKAALVSQKVGLESLPIASTPFLTPIAEKCLKDFATFFYWVFGRVGFLGF